MGHATHGPARVTLLGCGAVAEALYAPALRRLHPPGTFEHVTLVDTREGRLDAVACLLPGARRAMELPPSADLHGSLVVVALPHELHMAATVHALESGAHVLCEKPLGRTVLECRTMVDAAAAAGRVLGVGHFRRAYPVVRTIRDWICDGPLGALRSFRFLEGETYGWPAVADSLFRRETAGGGVLMDAGAHTLDLMLFWMGDVAQVGYADDAAGGVEANCTLDLQMESGVKGYIQLSRDWPLRNQYLFTFDAGWLVYSCDDATTFRWGLHDRSVSFVSTIEHAAGWGRDGLPRPGSPAAGFRASFDAQLTAMFAAISGAGRPVCTGAEGLATVALIERCYAVREPIEQPWLAPEEQQAVARMSGS
jgi:predicted dehydrogenase